MSQTQPEREDPHVHPHRLTVFSVAAAMVGVCLTGIGLLGVITAVKQVETLGDELLTAAATLFLLCAGLTFVAMRRAEQGRRTSLDRVADVLFFLGLALVLAVCAVLAFGIR